MILTQDEVTGFWSRISGEPEAVLKSHEPWDCEGRLCDVHNRRGPEPWASLPLNWRQDRAMMEFVCPHLVGHPTPAQVEFWRSRLPAREVEAQASHGCDGCCAGAYEEDK